MSGLNAPEVSSEVSATSCETRSNQELAPIRVGHASVVDQAENSFKGFVANQFFNRMDCTKWHGRDEFRERLLELLEESAASQPGAIEQENGTKQEPEQQP